MTFNRKILASSVAFAAATLMATGAQAEMSDDAVRIGYLADMSGTYRDLAGPGGLEALQMAIEDFGGEVNGTPIEVLSADDRNSADVGANTVREWFDTQNVDLVSGLVASSVAIAATKVVEENNGLAIVSGSAASSITNEHCAPTHIHWVYDTYPMANATAKAVVDQGGDSWFLLTADYAFGHAMEKDVTEVVEESGGTVVDSVRHPFPTTDFSSYILQAQGSGAKVVGLANAGGDTVNAIKTASQFGLTQSGQQLAGLIVFLNDIYAMGLEATQGLLLTTGWYWNMDEESREWAERYYERVGSMPGMVHAGIYSSTTHYLDTVKEIGTDDPEAVRAAMAEKPINDFFSRNGRIREDGRMVHDMYLVEVNSPEDATHDWDLYEVLSTIPAEQAYRPLSESQCDLVNN
ncbi:MAG: ABC transporter substrate-binding protein [Halomonas sp.]|uniref:ABC transporter substrate-binding protein n=1 Tax=Halomonas sp. TaxID=1486246 RepID=UPI001850585D|nr:ABC transporter substrate-binding protein [Halomonas sp.]NWN82108.1 ABC transporter substrate-binding protein [Halomonas sp.]